jgi:hypothetical protein
MLSRGKWGDFCIEINVLGMSTFWGVRWTARLGKEVGHPIGKCGYLGPIKWFSVIQLFPIKLFMGQPPP